MEVIREDTIRQMYIKNGMKEIFVPKGTFVTKEAMDYVKQHRLSLAYEDTRKEKPEHMTHMSGKTLVSKDHPRIVLRGKLDTLQAQIIEAQITCERLGEYKLIEDLESALSYVRKVMASEVRNIPVPDMKLFSMNMDELREKSHDPQKYFNMDHLIPSYEMGEVTSKFNLLRTSAREAEIAAVSAFSKDGTPRCTDIICALNRMSSGFYVLMLRYVSENHFRIKEWSGLWV